MKEGIIYKYTNKINGKVYIGQTIYPEKRYNQHKNADKHDCPKFHYAIDKYNGIENFDYEVLFKGDESLLDEKEIYYISLYNSTDDRFGYNIATGGNCLKLYGEDNPRYGVHLSQETKDKISKANKGLWLGKHHTQETKDKISESLKGRSFTQEHKDNLSKALKGQISSRKGKHLSQETKDKISESRMGKYAGKNHPEYHKGRLFEYNDQIYSSNELEQIINCNHTTINAHVNRGQTEFKVKCHLIKLIKKS